MADPLIDLTFDIPDYEPYNLDDDEDQTYYVHDEESKLEDFKKEMPIPLSVRNPKSRYELCAFWSQPTFLSPSSGSITDDWVSGTTPTSTRTTNLDIIREKIKFALLHFSNYSFYRVLIQFWAPIRTETGCLQLVTLDQPFAFSKHLDEGLFKYRKHCLRYKFNVDLHHGKEEEDLGIPGRVFRQKLHQCVPDVRYYNKDEYPQLDLAKICFISTSFAFPVFETSSQDCVGVLEFVSTRHFKDLFELCFGFLMDALKKADLKGSLCDCFSDWVALYADSTMDSAALIDKCLYHKTLAIHNKDNRDTLFEIKEGLKLVCRIHKLPLAQTWVPCRRQVLYVEKPASYLGGDNNHDVRAKFREFRDYCILNELQTGQGMVGKAYLSSKPLFCKDVTQFSLTEYPFLPGARKCGFTGCFVICLQSTCTREVDDFILEFFLNSENTYGEDPSTFLCSLLQTVKLHFPNFKLASGEQLGKELSIQFIKPKLAFGEQEQLGKELSIQFIKPSVNRELVSFQCPNTTSSWPEVLNNGQQTMRPPSSNQQQIAEGDDINKEQNYTHISRSITYEKLKNHFGEKIEDVAKIFGVSRSTLKRKLRENGISRWPQVKRNKVSGSFSRQESSCSDLTAEKLVATVPHMTPLVTTPPEVRAITIKATCGDDMLKFQLPFSSTMVELEEEVFKRLKLKNGTYKIKYTDEDGDRVLIACDKDLQDCMSASNSLGLNTIKMFIEILPESLLQPD